MDLALPVIFDPLLLHPPIVAASSKLARLDGQSGEVVGLSVLICRQSAQPTYIAALVAQDGGVRPDPLAAFPFPVSFPLFDIGRMERYMGDILPENRPDPLAVVLGPGMALLCPQIAPSVLWALIDARAPAPQTIQTLCQQWLRLVLPASPSAHGQIASQPALAYAPQFAAAFLSCGRSLDADSISFSLQPPSPAP